jgi:carboxyl-terminal processing protease
MRWLIPWRFVPFVVALSVGVLGGCATAPEAKVALSQFAPAERSRAEVNLAVFNRVWDLVNRKHYLQKTDGVDWQQVAATFGPKAAAAADERALYRVLNDMLELLHDSHTHALRPELATERRTHERARTGFSLTRLEDRWVVADVLEGSPAAEAGVRPGWIVLTRDGAPIDEHPDFRAREGDQVRWEFLDAEDRQVALTLPARRLTTAGLQVGRELEGGFWYLRFDEFNGSSRRWLARQLREHRKAPGVVVDLRRNPGGEVFSLGVIIGEFFDHAVDCGTFITRSGRRSVKNSWQFGSVHYAGRVVVLIDASSASSAEIFASVLKDHRRGTIVGRKSAGAVLASWFYPLPDGGQLQLSREDYMAPNGRRIETNGVEPDVVVTRTLADLRAGRDRDVEAALAILREQPAEPVAR